MIAWMLYTLLVSVLVVLGARAAEVVGRSVGYPVRWVWIGALGLLVGLTALAPYRREQRVAPTMVPLVVRGMPIVAPHAAPSWTNAIRNEVDAIRRTLNNRFVSVAQMAERTLPPRATTYAFAGWTVVTMAIVVLFLLVQLRYLRARRGWPLTDVQGVRVRVAPNVGPVVIGLARPEIVVPHWLLGRAAYEQRLVVAHEAEHVRARDTLLLGTACVVAAAMPWNPAVWYMLSRLRLAVELDCDARVLRGGAAPLSYGALLIDVAENNSGFRLGAPALADDSSHLHQRIMAMNAAKPKFALARGGVVGALGLVAVLAACEAKMPTSADVEALDASSAERVAREMALVKHSDSTIYFVDGVRTTAEKARAIAPTAIATIELKKTLEAEGLINIRTNQGPVAVATMLPKSERAARELRQKSLSDSIAVTYRPLKTALAKGNPLIYIDGVKSTTSAMATLNREDIESVEVLKGTAAAVYVNDPAAENGVIVVKTKKGGTSK